MVKKFKLVRIAQGYPSYKFASLVGVHPNTWYQIEEGRRKPTEKVMLGTSKILQRPVEELFADA